MSRGTILVQLDDLKDPGITFEGEVRPEEIQRVIYFVRLQYGNDYQRNLREKELANIETRRAEIAKEQQKIEIEKKEQASRDRAAKRLEEKLAAEKARLETEEVKAENQKLEAERIAKKEEEEKQTAFFAEEKRLRAHDRLVELHAQVQASKDKVEEIIVL